MRRIDLAGRRFGRLLVLGEIAERKNGHVYWACQCACGSVKSICGNSLRNGATTTCGCSIGEANVRRSRHGMTNTPEHKAWRQMLSRCTNPNNPGYRDYGERGITVCKRWAESFESFFEDMGRRPSNEHSLERKDTNGNYEPGNCRWATRAEQNANTRRSKRWIINGITYPSLEAAAAAVGLSSTTVLRRCNNRTPGYSSTTIYGD